MNTSPRSEITPATTLGDLDSFLRSYGMRVTVCATGTGQYRCSVLAPSLEVGTGVGDTLPQAIESALKSAEIWAVEQSVLPAVDEDEAERQEMASLTRARVRRAIAGRRVSAI